MSPYRPLYAASAALLTAAAAVLLSGCADEGGIESAGPTPTAIGPVRLWPDLPPVTAPPNDFGEAETELVPGIRLPGDDVRSLDPVDVVQAEVDAHPNQYSGPDGLYDETVRQLGSCREKPKTCPVLKPYYRDLTGDGRDELIVGIRMPEQQTAIRTYMPGKGGLTRIMSTFDQLVSVEIAGRDIILRSVSAGIPGYEYRTAWSWDSRQQAILPTRDEIIRVTPSPRASEPSRTPKPPGAPEPSRSATAPSAGAP